MNAGLRNSVGEEKKELLSRLLLSVKRCQSRFGSRTELATEDDKLISELCIAFENVFLHKFRRSTTTSKGIWQMTESLVPGLRTTEPCSFWPVVKSQLSKHEAERFLLLHNVRTDPGRGRAWLRAALNEHSLERYIHVILSLDNLHEFYEDDSFLRDCELSSILPQTAAGLGSILFALMVDNPELDKIDTESLASVAEDPIAKSIPELTESAGTADLSAATPPNPVENPATTFRKGKKKKKIPTAYVSFDEVESPPITSSSIRASPASHSSISVPPSKMADKMKSVPLRAVITTSSPREIPNASAHSMPIHQPEKITGVESSSLKSDNLSMYSDTSDRLDVENLSLSGISPSDRLKPVGSDESNLADRSQDLIPVPSYNTTEEEESTDFECEKNEKTSGNDSIGGLIFSIAKEDSESQSPEEDDRIRKLKAILDHEVEMVTILKAQLAEDRRQYNDHTKMLETRVETLSKENTILKHQLKKYIGAVQLLRDTSNVSRVTFHNEEVDTLNSISIDDEALERAEYERKLIQVAEMHGELMEFNAYLQNVLQRKDHALRIMRSELEDLRGPLGEDVGGVEGDTSSIDGPYSYSEIASAQRQFPFHSQGTSNERILINIWIPSAFLTGATNDLHHVYQVFIRIKDTEWNVYRRYSQFYNFHRELKKEDTLIGSFYFPPKKHIGNKDTKFVDERRRKLQEYLRKVMNHTLQTNSVLASHPDKNLLISILPFFGELNQPIKPKRSRSRGRNLFFRQSEPPEQQFFQGTGHPQYTGL